jgi:holo-[acyl-carrier protein] synthase|tara:strand:+ start:744 stop:1130 length:387 start_codon:yes stop_codon:yes gene_type:complete
MKILGIGVDIIENRRIKNSIKSIQFKKRIYSSKELKQSNTIKNKTNYFSKRFAAKEAFAKALGAGFRMNLNFKDIEVINDKMGKPHFVITKKIKYIVRKNFKIKNFNCFLSISDEKDYSTAFAIIQST